MRIVLDTNVLVSALINKGTPPDLLYQAWEAGRCQLATSRVQLAELERVLGYKKLRPFITQDEAEALLGTVGAAALVVAELPEIELSPDPDDNLILATAIAAEASLLVTGDRSGLLVLESVRGIMIVTPREAVERIERGRS